MTTTTTSPKAAASGSDLASMVARYHQSVADLDAFRKARYHRGQFVRVNDARFHGVGMVCSVDSSMPPHVLPVKLENGNTWWYPLESIIEVITDLAKVPREVRRMKMRWHGYKLGAAA